MLLESHKLLDNLKHCLILIINLLKHIKIALNLLDLSIPTKGIPTLLDTYSN